MGEAQGNILSEVTTEPSRTFGKVGGLRGLIASSMPAALRLAGSFMQLLVTILIARLLGLEAAGVYFFWVALMLEIGQMATFGTDKLAVRQIPRLDDSKPEAITNYLAPLRSTGLILAFLFGFLLCGYSFFSENPVLSPIVLCAVILASVCGVTLSMINSEAMTGMGRPVLAVVYRHTLPTTILLLALLLSRERLTADAAVVAYSVAFTVAGFGALWGPGFRKLGSPLRLPSREVFQRNVKEGSPIFLNFLFGSATAIIPLLIIEQIHRSDEISLLATSMRIFVLFGVLANAIYSLQMPELSRAAHAKDSSALFRIYRMAVLRGLLILGIPSVAVLIMAPNVMGIFGEGFERGAEGLRVFMVFAVLILVIGPSAQLILMLEKMKAMVWIAVGSCLVSAVTSFLVIPEYGALGFAYLMGGIVVAEHLLYLLLSWRGVRMEKYEKQAA